MAGPFVLAVFVLIGSLAALAVLVRRLARPTPTVIGRADVRCTPQIEAALRQARRRVLLCVGVAVVALVVGLRVDAVRPDLLGLPAALSPGLAATLALLVYAWWPARSAAADGTISAPLTPRTATSFGTRAGFAIPATVAVVFLGFLAWAAAVAGPDEQGRFREFPVSGPDWSAAAGPFPGPYYGLPLAAVTVLLAAATFLALRRVALTPVLPGTGLDAVDRAWRVVATRVVVRISTAALLGYVGGSLVFAGHAVRNAAGNAAASTGHRSTLDPVGPVLIGCGLMTLVAGIAVAFLAVLSAATLRSALPLGSATPPSVTGSPTRR